jgi:hypothetical protein
MCPNVSSSPELSFSCLTLFLRQRRTFPWNPLVTRTSLFSGGRCVTMEQITRVFWERTFERDFAVSRGSAFQTLFTRIMEIRHPNDFTQVRPWGKIGDQKCDGWLASEKRLFQVYAPDDLTKAATEKKMDTDFNGACVHWKGKFDHWNFVHNSRDGVPPFVLQKTQAFGKGHPLIGFTPWGFAELRSKLFELVPDDIQLILGPAPSVAAMQSVRFSDVEKVLQHLLAHEPPPGADLRPVPADKLQENSLSEDVSGFLRLGMIKSSLVAQFFANYRDPRYGDALAFKFKEEYLELKARNLSPDDIFWELRGYAGANDATSNREQAAALAILSHFFEECDIFERPGENGEATGVN